MAKSDRQPKNGLSRRTVFVSHASKDREIAKIIVHLMEASGVPAESIRFTSQSELGISPGQLIPSWIRKELRAAGLVVALLSSTYVKRPWCQVEFGAAFVLDDELLLPLALPSTAHDDSSLPSGLLVPGLRNAEDLDDQLWTLYRRLVRRVVPDLDHEAWRRSMAFVEPSLRAALDQHATEAAASLAADGLREEAVHELGPRLTLWRATGHSHEFIAPGDVRGKAVAAWMAGWEPPEDVLDYLFYSACFDGWLLPIVNRMVVERAEFILPGSSLAWLRKDRFRRPRYRWALTVQTWPLVRRTEAIAGARKLPTTPVMESVLAAIEAGDVVGLITDEERTPELEASQRRDVLEFARSLNAGAV